MKNRYWLIIIAAIIALAFTASFLTYKITSENWYWYGYNSKNCVDYCDERISSCFMECKDMIYLDTIGPIAYQTCVFKCIHPNYFIAKI